MSLIHLVKGWNEPTNELYGAMEVYIDGRKDDEVVDKGEYNVDMCGSSAI